MKAMFTRGILTLLVAIAGRDPTPLFAQASTLDDPAVKTVNFGEPAERDWELSGVAERDGVFFMVSDKTHTKDKLNTIVIYDAKQSAKEGSLSPTQFGTKPLKLEDISYHRPSDTFFVTGAQFSNDNRKIYRFGLKKEDNRWVVSGIVKEVILSRQVEEFYPQPVGEWKPVAEGLSAVSDESGKTVLWIGLRTDGPPEGKFRVLEYRGRTSSNDEVHFDFRGLHEFDVSPARTEDTYAIHLSGLYYAGDGTLAVLGTTEDKQNFYHGNIIYLVDTRTWEQIGAGPVFTPDQKAEGITIWENRVGIVYDNDQKSVSEKGRPPQPSSLRIFTPILPSR